MGFSLKKAFNSVVKPALKTVSTQVIKPAIKVAGKTIETGVKKVGNQIIKNPEAALGVLNPSLYAAYKQVENKVKMLNAQGQEVYSPSMVYEQAPQAVQFGFQDPEIIRPSDNLKVKQVETTPNITISSPTSASSGMSSIVKIGAVAAGGFLLFKLLSKAK